MTPTTEKRINDVAKKLAETRVSRVVERRSATIYVRATKAIDPDTHGVRSAGSDKRR